jgi:hypothetical protein
MFDATERRTKDCVDVYLFQTRAARKALAEMVHCYPTQTEVFQRIALEYART